MAPPPPHKWDPRSERREKYAGQPNLASKRVSAVELQVVNPVEGLSLHSEASCCKLRSSVQILAELSMSPRVAGFLSFS